MVLGVYGSSNSIGRVALCGRVGWEFESLLLPSIRLISLPPTTTGIVVGGKFGGGGTNSIMAMHSTHNVKNVSSNLT